MIAGPDESWSPVYTTQRTSGYFNCIALMATQSTRSPPPPALQYGWKNATVVGSESTADCLLSLLADNDDAEVSNTDGVWRLWCLLNHQRNAFRNPGRRENSNKRAELRTTFKVFHRVTGRVSDIFLVWGWQPVCWYLLYWQIYTGRIGRSQSTHCYTYSFPVTR